MVYQPAGGCIPGPTWIETNALPPNQTVTFSLFVGCGQIKWSISQTLPKSSFSFVTAIKGKPHRRLITWSK